MSKTTAFSLLLIALTGLSGGCAAGRAPASGHVIFIAPGAGGDGQWRRNIVNGLRDAGVVDHVEVVKWGAPLPLFVLNFQNTAIHRAAEKKLAERIVQRRRDRANDRIALIGHSAGGGVILGALRRLPADVRVQRVVLLAPSVSPGYELGPSLERVDEQLHVFHSTNDTLFLKWRTGTFGTYDNVRTPAAGHLGFTSAGRLSPDLLDRLIQHAYNSDWRTLGNDGGHFGATARGFARAVLAPLLTVEAPTNGLVEVP